MKQTFSDAFKWVLMFASRRICIGMGKGDVLDFMGQTEHESMCDVETTSSWNVSRAETGNAINYPPTVVLPVCGLCYFIRCCCSCCCCYCCCDCHCWFKNKHNIHSSKEKPLQSHHPQFDVEAALAVNLWNNEIYEYCSGKYDILVTLCVSVCVCVGVVGCGCVRAKSETQSSMMDPATAAGTVRWHEHGEHAGHTARSVGIFAKWPLKPK